MIGPTYAAVKLLRLYCENWRKVTSVFYRAMLGTEKVYFDVY